MGAPFNPQTRTAQTPVQNYPPGFQSRQCCDLAPGQPDWSALHQHPRTTTPWQPLRYRGLLIALCALRARGGRREAAARGNLRRPARDAPGRRTMS